MKDQQPIASEPTEQPKPILTDSELLNLVERFHLTVGRSGYRGRWGWEVLIADPGGHYQEERMKAVGHGLTAREALTQANERLNR